MKTILVAGGTGLVGQLLTKKLKEAGYEIRLLSRYKPSNPCYPTFLWNVEKGVADQNAFHGVDMVINLAGAGVADKPWTKSRKEEITQSRVKSNALLAHYFHLVHRPAVYLSAGAIGYYGNGGDTVLTEEAAAGHDFLSDSCRQWENAVLSTRSPEMRTVIFRIGIVLSTKGGALQKMLLPWKMGIATSFNPGNQWYSWIHEEDLVQLFLFAIQNENVEGIYNAVSPNPVTMQSFAETMKIRSKLPWRMVFSVPQWLLSGALGEMSTVLKNSARVSCKKITDLGCHFTFPTLEEALKDLIG
jgi:uncharacterized protein (TIGR01777 family)